MKKLLKDIHPNAMYFISLMLIVIVVIFLFMFFYFKAYDKPYMTKQMADISDHWSYEIESTGQTGVLDNLKYACKVEPNDTIRLHKTLDIEIPKASVLVKTNHQTINLYIDGEEIFSSGVHDPNKNPGMALFFVPLPDNYKNKELTISIISPYRNYAGRTSSIYIGDIPSLEAFTISKSMRSVIFMALCIFLGLCTIILTIVQAIYNRINYANLAIGVFSVVWGFYFVCTDFITYQFFSPSLMSDLSIGLYFLMHPPLILFFYLSFKHYKRLFLPTTILHSGFVVIAFLLRIFNVLRFPEILNINNVIYVSGFFITIVVSILEIRKKNRYLILVTPFMCVAYYAIVQGVSVFYGTKMSVNYDICKYTFFLLALVVLIYNILQFFRDYYKAENKADILALQNRLAIENYEQLKTYTSELGTIKHEMNSHLAAIQILLNEGLHEKAQQYLLDVTNQIVLSGSAIYCKNMVINAVVGKHYHLASSKKIHVNLNINVPEKINISDADMNSLLTNILENSIEASALATSSEHRKITLDIGTKPPYLYISCTNGKEHEIVEKEDKILTSKENEREHGYGISIIKRIVEKYDGIINITYNENSFTIRVGLKES